jgi:hypothetical protein
MRVLVKGEFSGVVREAFRRLGHDAWSNDLLPAEDGSRYHILGNYTEKPGEWDLGIFHPPCTFLCNSGVRWLYLGGKATNGPDEQRWVKMAEAARFFNNWLNSPIPRRCIENPIMHKYAKEIVTRDPTQIIQPWMFGHGEIKAACLWLVRLRMLVPTTIVNGRFPRVHQASPGPDRWKERSRTLKGVADAMAAQWGTE